MNDSAHRDSDHSIIEDLPLLIFESPPEAIAIMLDDIREELGPDVIGFLRQVNVLGRVIAVLLECKCAGHTPNLLETISLAQVEQECATLLRDQHPMSFTIEDLDAIIEHAMPAFTDKASKILLGEKNPRDLFQAC